jgi:hypothetical protein
MFPQILCHEKATKSPHYLSRTVVAENIQAAFPADAIVNDGGLLMDTLTLDDGYSVFLRLLRDSQHVRLANVLNFVEQLLAQSLEIRNSIFDTELTFSELDSIAQQYELVAASDLLLQFRNVMAILRVRC